MVLFFGIECVAESHDTNTPGDLQCICVYIKMNFISTLIILKIKGI